MKNPRLIGFVISAALGVASLVIYQNCGLPNPQSGQNASSAPADVFRWMPSVFASFSCDNPINGDAYPRAWLLTQATNSTLPPSYDQAPAGVSLSVAGKKLVAGLSSTDAVSKLPPHEILLSPLVPDSAFGKSSDQWNIAPDYSFDRTKTNAVGGLTLNVFGPAGFTAAGGPALRIAAGQAEPFGRSGVYLATPMKIYIDNFTGGFNSNYSQFAVGLFLADQTNYNPLSAQNAVIAVNPVGKTGPVGSALVALMPTVDSPPKGHILANLLEVDSAGRFDSSHNWICPLTMNQTSVSLRATPDSNTLFMIFHHQDSYSSSASIPANQYGCVVNTSSAAQDAISAPGALKNDFYFGTIYLAQTAVTGAFKCVVSKTITSNSDCYSNVGVADYSLTNPTDFTTKPATGKVRPEWLSICTRN